VTLAEQRIARAGRTTLAGVAMHRKKPKSFAPIRLPQHIALAASVAPVLRGLAAQALGPGRYRRWILAFRSSPQILDFVNGTELGRYARQGTATPDHVIRTKRLPLITPPADALEMGGFAAGARAAMENYQAAYHAYFAANNARQTVPRSELDPVPRVILVPGLGLFGVGASAAAAEIAADLAETNVEVIAAAEAVGTFTAVSEAEAFDIEYWSLEQAKLGKATEKPLARHVVVVTGGGSGIGAACARAFRAAGAEVSVLDIDQGAAEAVAAETGGLGLACDVTRRGSVEAAFDRVSERYGGVDIVVSNAGRAWQGRIGEVDEQTLRDSFELNFWAHQAVAQAAVAVMSRQQTGGCLLFNASKQAIDPGPNFGPYGLPKAATLALMRQYALDHGRDGIRASAVNADRIRTGLLDETMIGARARARGVSPEVYMSGNLLGLKVTAADVAAAFVHLALSEKTTAAVLTVDGGNIAASLR
ncbi:MAG: bifunctional aldolase/short-chain dehydrogenase, partial [Rhodospirillales bacterium]